MLASAIGYIMATIFMFFFFTIAVTALFVGLAMFSSSKDVASYSLKDKSILVLNLEGELTERKEHGDVVKEVFYDDRPKNIGLYELEKTLKKAASDKKIIGLYLRLRWVSGGWAKIDALRRMLNEFKASGKFIYSYSEAYDEKLYYLASISDEIFMYPKGDFEWNGIYSKSMFFKKTLDKLEIEPSLIRAGRYKSAGEMIIRENMSEENRYQINEMVQGIWQHVVQKISESRPELTPEKLNTIAKEILVQDAQEAYNQNMVTQLLPIEEIEKKLIEVSQIDDDEPRLVAWQSYYEYESKPSKSFLSKKDKVAVIVASGEILMGRGNEENRVYSDDFSILIRELSKEDDVKAVVLRIDSPGGSALASDVIWRSLEYLKKANKKLITSFSDVAASGGYYIAAGSDYIYAEPTTITGSIGVFGMLFNTSEFFDHKLGVTFDQVKTHDTADMMTGRKLTAFETGKIQSSVNSIYKTFLYVVQQGRPRFQSPEDVNEIAEGRVWLGQKALEIGLVDGLGSLDDAVKKAAEMAKLKNYEVVLYPEQKRWIEKIFASLGDIWTPTWIKDMLQWIQPQSKDKVMARLPFTLEIH